MFKMFKMFYICAFLSVFLCACLLQSVVARSLLNSIQEKAGYLPVYINFSAQTSSARTQEIIESKLEKKRKYVLGTGSQLVYNTTINILQNRKSVWKLLIVMYS